MSELTGPIRDAYKTFFESEAGAHFIDHVKVLIESNHSHAESKPDYSRDFVQRAKGNREVIEYINSAVNGVNKKRMS